MGFFKNLITDISNHWFVGSEQIDWEAKRITGLLQSIQNGSYSYGFKDDRAYKISYHDSVALVLEEIIDERCDEYHQLVNSKEDAYELGYEALKNRAINGRNIGIIDAWLIATEFSTGLTSDYQIAHRARVLALDKNRLSRENINGQPFDKSKNDRIFKARLNIE